MENYEFAAWHLLDSQTAGQQKPYRFQWGIMKKDKKEKKEKITYVDDGSTIADMSPVRKGSGFAKKSTSSGFREIWKTYWTATRMMIVPTLIAAGFVLAAYAIILILFKLM